MYFKEKKKWDETKVILGDVTPLLNELIGEVMSFMEEPELMFHLRDTLSAEEAFYSFDTPIDAFPYRMIPAGFESPDPYKKIKHYVEQIMIKNCREYEIDTERERSDKYWKFIAESEGFDDSDDDSVKPNDSDDDY